jgi:SAM-dependent methyltransferase
MSDPDPAVVARQLLMGFRGTHLLFVAAELGVADVLQHGPLAVDEIAARLAARRDPLRRVLRALAQLGVLTEASDGWFSLTPVGDCLRTDRPESLRPLARFWGHEMMQRAWGALLHTIMTGETAFDHALGMSAFTYLQSHPDAAAIYHDGMAKIQLSETNAVIDAYEFPPSGTIVDVGGGNGSLLAAVLQTVPATDGVVFDLPNAQSDVEATIRRAGLSDRIRFEPGDFFTEVTADGDCYLLRQIIHDWDDDDAVAILRSCRRAIAPAGRLLIVELILPPEGADSLEAVMIDVTMLVRLGGRERTAVQYATLLEEAGFNLDRVISTAGRQSVLECSPTKQSGRHSPRPTVGLGATS